MHARKTDPKKCTRPKVYIIEVTTGEIIRQNAQQQRSVNYIYCKGNETTSSVGNKNVEGFRL